jgi:hypothetical protein
VHFSLSVNVQVVRRCGAAEDITTAAAQVGQIVTMAISDMWLIEEKIVGNQEKLKLMDRDTKT